MESLKDRHMGSVRDAAARWSISEKSIRRMIDAGDLTAYSPRPHALRVDLDELDKLCMSRHSYPVKKPAKPAAKAPQKAAKPHRKHAKRSYGSTDPYFELQDLLEDAECLMRDGNLGIVISWEEGDELREVTFAPYGKTLILTPTLLYEDSDRRSVVVHSFSHEIDYQGTVMNSKNYWNNVDTLVNRLNSLFTLKKNMYDQQWEDGFWAKPTYMHNIFNETSDELNNTVIDIEAELSELLKERNNDE